MNTAPHLEEIKVNYNTEEWISAFPGGITSVEVDGDKLISLRKVNKTVQRLKILSVLLAGVLIGVLGEYLLVRNNILPDQELKELKEMKWKNSQISREASINLHNSGVMWNQDKRIWVWAGNGLAISSHNKDEIRD